MTRMAMKVFRTLMIASLILALGIAPALAASVPAWINNSKATVYVNANEKMTLKAGTGVYVTGMKSGWAQIKHNDDVGYVKVKNLTLVEGITGYVKKSAYVYKSASKSAKKVGPLGVGTAVKVVGVNGSFFQVTNGKYYGYIPKGALSKSKPSDVAIMASKVKLVSWSQANAHFPKGSRAQIYDIQSGLLVNVYRVGGSKHAEMEPATTEDAAKLYKMGGGKYSWNSRPVILRVGDALVAAAINTMPHGDEVIKDNNFKGQFCLHLPGSKTHGTGKENVNHQAAIKAAYAWAQTRS